MGHLQACVHWSSATQTLGCKPPVLMPLMQRCMSSGHKTGPLNRSQGHVHSQWSVKVQLYMYSTEMVFTGGIFSSRWATTILCFKSTNVFLQMHMSLCLQLDYNVCEVRISLTNAKLAANKFLLNERMIKYF